MKAIPFYLWTFHTHENTVIREGVLSWWTLACCIIVTPELSSLHGTTTRPTPHWHDTTFQRPRER